MSINQKKNEHEAKKNIQEKLLNKYIKLIFMGNKFL